MAGLAAMIGPAAEPAEVPADVPADALVDALAVRGPETARWRVGGLRLMVRAAMPSVSEANGRALVLDGNAAPSALASAYTTHGPPAMLAGPDPYAVVLADPARDALVLGRHGDGPPLYWAWHGTAVLAASEVAALLAAGVPADPDPEVVERFLATGTCDDTAATFVAGIQRVLPGQVVEVVRDPGAATFTVRSYETAAVPAPARLPEGGLPEARLPEGGLPEGGLPEGRLGVRLGHSPASIALLETTLHTPGTPRPLPVYSATFPELATGGAGPYAAPVLAPLARSAAVRHRALPFFADEVDVDAYLADAGEPTPLLDDWLLWAVARRVAGEVDVLVDSVHGGYASRLADRIANRFGVVLHAPSSPPARPPASPSALVRDLLWRMREELVTTFLQPQWPAGSGLDELAVQLPAGRVDPGALWRRYVLERWLRQVAEPAARPAPATVGSATPAAPPEPITVDGRTVARLPVRTEPLAAGDKLPEKIAWYVGEALLDRKPGPEPAATGWYVLLAARPVAVMQGRARNLWDITPGPTARALHRLTGRTDGQWVLQVAIEEGGWWRAVAGVVTAAVDRRFGPFPGWYERVAGPAVCAVRGPRPDAVPPGQVAVIPAPAAADRVAADVVAALRTALPEQVYATFRGCAVVSATQLLGWAARPGTDGAPPAAAYWADDPFGDDQTPVVVATPVSQR